jgi:hypothetical protein
MKSLSDYDISELKLIYQMMHEQLPSSPTLMDSELLHDLQTYLQQQASKDGVDVSMHAQWSSWLNDGTNLKGL